MRIRAFNETEFGIIIFVIIKQCPMGVSCVGMYREDRIFVRYRILFGDTRISFCMSDAVKVQYLDQLADARWTACFHIYNPPFCERHQCGHETRLGLSLF